MALGADFNLQGYASSFMPQWAVAPPMTGDLAPSGYDGRAADANVLAMRASGGNQLTQGLGGGSTTEDILARAVAAGMKPEDVMKSIVVPGAGEGAPEDLATSPFPQTWDDFTSQLPDDAKGFMAALYGDNPMIANSVLKILTTQDGSLRGSNAPIDADTFATTIQELTDRYAAYPEIAANIAKWGALFQQVVNTNQVTGHGQGGASAYYQGPGGQRSYWSQYETPEWFYNRMTDLRIPGVSRPNPGEYTDIIGGPGISQNWTYEPGQGYTMVHPVTGETIYSAYTGSSLNLARETPMKDLIPSTKPGQMFRDTVYPGAQPAEDQLAGTDKRRDPNWML